MVLSRPDGGFSAPFRFSSDPKVAPRRLSGRWLCLCDPASSERQSADACKNEVFDQLLRDYKNTIMNKDVLEFVTYCISCLARRLSLSKTEVYNRLNKSGILYEYVVPCYDVLHTFSTEYLMEDLTDFMKEKGVLQ